MTFTWSAVRNAWTALALAVARRMFLLCSAGVSPRPMSTGADCAEPFPPWSRVKSCRGRQPLAYILCQDMFGLSTPWMIVEPSSPVSTFCLVPLPRPRNQYPGGRAQAILCLLTSKVVHVLLGRSSSSSSSSTGGDSGPWSRSGSRLFRRSRPGSSPSPPGGGIAIAPCLPSFCTCLAVCGGCSSSTASATSS